MRIISFYKIIVDNQRYCGQNHDFNLSVIQCLTLHCRGLKDDHGSPPLTMEIKLQIVIIVNKLFYNE